MAKVKRSKSNSNGVSRVSPLKPGLRGARNWTNAQFRAARYTRRGFIRLVSVVLIAFSFMAGTGLWLGGFLPHVNQAGQNFVQSRLVAMGFVINRVDIMGEGRLPEAEIRKHMGVEPGDYLFSADMQTIQTRVEALSWVDHAVVRRLWPDRIVVQVIERRPFALWQNQGTFKVVDITGKPIENVDVSIYAELPLIVGPRAPQKAQEITSLINAYPEIAKRTTAFVHVNEMRWNIQLNDGTLWVKLPSYRPDAALRRLDEMHRDKAVLDRAIAEIDLRLSDRISFLPLKATGA